MEFKIWLERYGGAKSMIVYHGTKPELLSSILSQGLIPNPKTRAWQDDDNTSFLSPTRKSLESVYITTNLMTAFSSAPPRDKLIIIAEVQPRAMYADEDDLSSNIGQVTDHEYTLVQLYLTWKTGGSSNLSEYKQKYKDKAFQRIKYKLGEVHPKLLKRVDQLLDKFFYVALDRQTAHVDKVTFNRARAYYPKADHVEQPEIKQAELNHLQAMEQITRTLKAIGQPHRREETTMFNFTARLNQPIKFHGKNKIIAIVEMFYKEGLNKQFARVKYGEVPQQFIEDWGKSVGPWDEAIN